MSDPIEALERLGKAPDVPIPTVEWRVQGRPRDKQCMFVAYADARIVGDLLDEWVGADRWSDEYATAPPPVQGGLECRLTILTRFGPVTRCDVGTESDMESAKGAYSDAFKRAAAKWGVGRNVYRLPIVWAPCDVRTVRGNDQAFANSQTHPAILAKLKREGYDVDTVRTADAPPETVTEQPKRTRKKPAAKPAEAKPEADSRKSLDDMSVDELDAEIRSLGGNPENGKTERAKRAMLRGLRNASTKASPMEESNQPESDPAKETGQQGVVDLSVDSDKGREGSGATGETSADPSHQPEAKS